MFLCGLDSTLESTFITVNHEVSLPSIRKNSDTVKFVSVVCGAAK